MRIIETNQGCSRLSFSELTFIIYVIVLYKNNEPKINFFEIKLIHANIELIIL